MSLFDSALFDLAAFDAPPVRAVLPVRVDVVGKENAALPVRVSVFSDPVSTDAGTLAAVWSMLVYVRGVNETANVVGAVTIEAEENAARVADLALYRAHGTSVTPSDWIGAPVEVWIANWLNGSPVNAVPIFTGLVELPTLTPGSGLLRLRCGDGRQAMIDALDAAALDDMFVGAKWSAIVFDKGAPMLTRSADLLSTVEASLDVVPGAGLRFTGWRDTLPEFAADDDVVLDESVSVDFAERSGMTNRVTITFDYRYPRASVEGYLIGYDILSVAQTSFGQWVKDGGQFLMRETVTRAIEAAGASIASIEWIELPTNSVQLPNNSGYWLPNPAQHNLLCLGFGAVVSFDFNNETTDRYNLIVQNAESIARFGVISSQMSGALDGIYEDQTAQEHAALLYKKKISTIPPRSTVPISVGKINVDDIEVTPETDYSAAVTAIECMIAIAKTQIAAAHRRNTVTARVPATPYVDLWNRVTIDASGVAATGKVKRVVHLLDAASGEATTEFTLAVSSCAGTGFTHPVTMPTAPTRVTASDQTDVSAVTINWNGAYGQDGTLTVSFPEVHADDRNSAQNQASATYETDIAEDEFEVTL